MRLFGVTAGGAMLARGALIAIDADGGDPALQQAKVTTARFYAEQMLPQATGLATTVAAGATSLMAIPEDRF
jgi:hypothetical protein